MRIIAVVNQKGGCGKTTTAINLAAVFAERGHRTLLVDMDPQAHCAAGLGVPESEIEIGIGQALLANHEDGLESLGGPEALIWEVARNLHLLPSTMRLTSLEAPGGGLHKLPDKDRRLSSLLSTIKGFDCCLIDCPPTIGLLTFNALRASREALIPVETGFFAMKGAHKQWNTIQKTIERIGRPIACHLVPTLHRPEMKTAEDILLALRRDFAGQIIPVVIREHDALREAASFGQPVLEYAPRSEAHSDFVRLAEWLEGHRPEPQLHIEVMPTTMLNQTMSAGLPEPPRPLAGPLGATGRSVDPAEMSSRAAELARRVRDLSLGEADGQRQTPEVEVREIELHDAGGPAARVPEPAPPAQPPVRPTPASIATKPVTTEPVGARPAPVIRPQTQQAQPAPTNSPPLPTTRQPSPAQSAPRQVLPDVGPPDAAPALREDVRPLREEIMAPEGGQTQPQRQLDHLYGVRQTSQGVLFVQPGSTGRVISVAGEFNGWSTKTHPLTYNSQLDIYQAIIAILPGTYQYRIVVDGRWQADPYNPDRGRNTYGEANSVITVQERP